MVRGAEEARRREPLLGEEARQPGDEGRARVGGAQAIGVDGPEQGHEHGPEQEEEVEEAVEADRQRPDGDEEPEGEDDRGLRRAGERLRIETAVE